MNVANAGGGQGYNASSAFKTKTMLNYKIEGPKEIFVWRRDKKTNYNRFNEKFEMKFAMALELLNSFRDQT
jgi:hypothetical protein